LSSYQVSAGAAGAMVAFNNKFEFQLPMPGRHNAANALAIVAAFDLLGLPLDGVVAALSGFKGVWRRCDYAGKLESGARVYDDYAHNVEKIISSMNAARENASGKIIVIFQPHGFAPLGFMRDELFLELEKNMTENDVFALLPPYYAGGTTSFKPTSEEVAADYKTKSRKKYEYFMDRLHAETYIRRNTSGNDVVVIMGARDNSLAEWAKQLTV
jgi:UDP-N-acetylmuramate--alanine ligase